MKNKKPGDLYADRRHNSGVIHGWLLWYLRRSQRQTQQVSTGELSITPGGG